MFERIHGEHDVKHRILIASGSVLITVERGLMIRERDMSNCKYVFIFYERVFHLSSEDFVCGHVCWWTRLFVDAF